MVFCRATTLVARVRDRQKYTILAVFFNPFPLRDFPYLTTFAGAEKITLSYYIASIEAMNMQTGDTGLIKKRRLRDITSCSRPWSVLLYSPLPGFI